jgi:hypothetical protein
MKSRSRDFFYGQECRPIGITYRETAIWVDVPHFIINREGKEIKVFIKYNMPIVSDPTSIHGGELRINFANQPEWLWQGASFLDPEEYGTNVEMARAEAMDACRKLLGQTARVLD